MRERGEGGRGWGGQKERNEDGRRVGIRREEEKKREGAEERREEKKSNQKRKMKKAREKRRRRGGGVELRPHGNGGNGRDLFD